MTGSPKRSYSKSVGRRLQEEEVGICHPNFSTMHSTLLLALGQEGLQVLSLAEVMAMALDCLDLCSIYLSRRRDSSYIHLDVSDERIHVEITVCSSLSLLPRSCQVVVACRTNKYPTIPLVLCPVYDKRDKHLCHYPSPTPSPLLSHARTRIHTRTRMTLLDPAR